MASRVRAAALSRSAVVSLAGVHPFKVMPSRDDLLARGLVLLCAVTLSGGAWRVWCRREAADGSVADAVEAALADAWTMVRQHSETGVSLVL